MKQFSDQDAIATLEYINEKQFGGQSQALKRGVEAIKEGKANQNTVHSTPVDMVKIVIEVPKSEFIRCRNLPAGKWEEAIGNGRTLETLKQNVKRLSGIDPDDYDIRLKNRHYMDRLVSQAEILSVIDKF